MAVVKKIIDGVLKSFPLNTLIIEEGGCYKLNQQDKSSELCLQPNGPNNQPGKITYSCKSNVKELIKAGNVAIYSDESETYSTFFSSVRDGLKGSNYNDIVYLSYEDDRFMGNYGDDFIEINNQYINTHGDAGEPTLGGNDVAMIRCGNTHTALDGGSDHYFINISDNCREDDATKNIVIYEEPVPNEANIVHLCDVSFLDKNQNKVLLKPSEDKSNLEIYLSGSNNEPDLIISSFCEFMAISNIPTISAIYDNKGMELKLSSYMCDKEVIIDHHM